MIRDRFHTAALAAYQALLIAGGMIVVAFSVFFNGWIDVVPLLIAIGMGWALFGSVALLGAVWAAKPLLANIFRGWRL